MIKSLETQNPWHYQECIGTWTQTNTHAWSSGKQNCDRQEQLTKTRHRSVWRKNSWPRPMPRCAPSNSPGKSATTIVESNPIGTTPKLGRSVVNGYAAIAGCAALITLKRVLFPALGTPIIPTSATSFSSSSSHLTLIHNNKIRCLKDKNIPSSDNYGNP